MEEAESNAILDQLYEIGERREFIFEHVWKLGDFLMWDNRCTIHARTDFPKEERRLLLRRCWSKASRFMVSFTRSARDEGIRRKSRHLHGSRPWKGSSPACA